MIKLGDKVRCKVSGFVGVAVVRSEFINGCVQYDVQGRVSKDNKIPESVGIDQQSLEVIKTPKKKVVKRKTGGPNSRSRTMSGY